MEKQSEFEFSQQHKYSASAKGDSSQFQQMQFSKSHPKSESQNIEMNNSKEIINFIIHR